MGTLPVKLLRRHAARVIGAVLGVLLAIGSVMPTAAQELAPEHLTLAREYVDLTDTSGIFEVSLVQTGLQTVQSLLAQNPGLGQQVDAAVGKVLESYRGKKGQLLDQFARVYALRFSMDELRDIVAFYKSPTGQKLAAANVGINTELQTVMQVFENNLRPEFYAKVRAELKAAGITL